MSIKDASQEICIPVVFAAASVMLYLLASRCALSVCACDFSHDMNFHDMCVSPCSLVTDYDDDQLLGRVETKILCAPGISFHTLVSAVFAEMEPFVYLGDLVRMMISSRHYFNSEIKYKASLYKYWVSEWEEVLMERAADGWANDDCQCSVCEDESRRVCQRGCPCSVCCERPHYREWARLCEQQGQDCQYSVDDLGPPE